MSFSKHFHTYKQIPFHALGNGENFETLSIFFWWKIKSVLVISALFSSFEGLFKDRQMSNSLIN